MMSSVVICFFGLALEYESVTMAAFVLHGCAPLDTGGGIVVMVCG